MICWKLIGKDGNIVERYYITVDSDKLTMTRELDIMQEIERFNGKRRKDDEERDE